MEKETWQQKWTEYITEKKKTQQIIQNKISKWEKERAHAISKLPRGERERENWKILKENLRPVNEKNIKLKGKKGETEKEGELKEIIQDFWKDIIQRTTKEDTTIKTIRSERHNATEEILTKEEVTQAIKKMKNRKAAGCDDIVAELIKRGEKMKTVLHNIFSESFETGQIPEDWRKSRVELIHKGGRKEKTEIGNYRPISIINILNKLFGEIINDKMQRWVEQEGVIGEEQSGFRKGRSGLENIYVLKELIDRSKRERKKFVSWFPRHRESI